MAQKDVWRHLNYLASEGIYLAKAKSKFKGRWFWYERRHRNKLSEIIYLFASGVKISTLTQAIIFFRLTQGQG